MNIKRPLVFQNDFKWEVGVEKPNITDIEKIRFLLKRDDICLFNFSEKDAKQCHVLINELAKNLQITTPFVSSTNKKYHSKNFYENVNYLGSNELNSHHVVFDQTSGQSLHCDGTFEKIGKVGTTILCCLNPSYFGGESVFFHATKAFEYFYQTNESLARLFTLPNSLRRYNAGYEHIHGTHSTTDVAFKKDGDRWISRFTIDPTADWQTGFNEIDGLESAFLNFQIFYAIDSPYVKIFRLEKNQGVIFNNNRISHGRLPFVNNPHQSRLYCRGLFVEEII